MKAKVVFSGDLEYLNLGELIQLIGSNGSTGVLRIISKYIEAPGLVYFKDGNPVEARAESLGGLNALYKLFGWTEGDFEFSSEPVTMKPSIQKSRMEIILEGLRLLDDNEIDIKGAVSFDAKGKVGGRRGLPVIKGPLIDYMDVVAEEEYPAGHPIVHQGRHGTWMWVVLEGEVEICKEIAGKMVKILKVGPGSFIGSMGSFDQQGGDVRSATAIASDRVQLGVLDRQRLTHEFASLSADLRNLILSLDRRLKQVTRLAAVDIDLKKQKIPDVTRGKAPIIKLGDKQERLMSIKQGKAFVVNEISGHNLVLAQLEKNDLVGKIPFVNIGHEPESSAVYGTDDVKMKAIDAGTLVEEHERLSGTLINMIDNCANFIAATTSIILSSQKKINK